MFSATKSSVIFADEQKDVIVRHVHLVFSHHLDVGLDVNPNKITKGCVGFATSIVRRYFDTYIPRAIDMANKMRLRTTSSRRFSYQIHPWIANLYVNCVSWSVSDGCENLSVSSVSCPSEEDVERFDDAVRRGDIVWSHSPFNVDPEIVGDPDLFVHLVTIANDLDARYGIERNATRVWSNVDVKGFARSAIPLLKKAGYEALYVGQNGGPTPPAEAKTEKGLQPVVGDKNATMFRWQDPTSDEEIVVMYVDGYGGFASRDACIVTSDGIALASYYRSDNAGPPESVAEVDAIFDHLEYTFPHASIEASSFERFAREALTSKVVNALPSTTLDWGDQWITGMSTDPFRLATYREMVRARRDCVNRGDCDPSSPSMRNFTRFIAKNVEHTQGVQNEEWSPGIAGPLQDLNADRSHWSNEEFNKVHNADENKFFMGDWSWLENRVFNSLALSALGANHTLTHDIRRRLADLVPRRPDVSMLRDVTNWADEDISCGPTRLRVASDGGLATLTRGASTARDLFQLTYVTYNESTETWDPRQNMTCEQEGCANPESRVWVPETRSVHTNCTTDSDFSSCVVVAQASFDPHLHDKYGAMTDVFVEYTLYASGTNTISVDMSWFDKRTTRLPESVMLSFRPTASSAFSDETYGWAIDVLGSWVSTEDVSVFGSSNPYQVCPVSLSLSLSHA